ncbi:MAG: hypothetical protein QM756_32530 [Polyangiaceae bacterium]
MNASLFSCGRSLFLSSALLGALGTLACSPAGSSGQQGNGGSSNASGGQSATGGSGQGGSGQGGSGQGGSAQGGASNGGSANGGTTTGQGGAASGGTASGGATAGGASSGGAAQGGSTSGGSTSGGATQGGSSSAGSGGAQGGSTAGGCPNDASFCTSFENAALPTGAVFKLNGDPATPWTAYFELDSSISKTGRTSLRVKAMSENSGGYKMLAVPSGGSKFWVRAYIRSDKDLGDEKHNAFMQAGSNDSPDDKPHIEFAEDVGIAWNANDVVRWPTGYGRLTSGATMPYTLAKDTWHCVELSFDGQGRVYKVYVNGTELISTTDFPASTITFTHFKFGYNALNNGERKTWYDDIVVAPNRVNCLP